MKVNEFKKKEKGITLIALVVTIIILLVLAGISISALTGQNGIITRTIEAKFQSELADYNEQLSLFIFNKQMENINFDKSSLTSGKDSINYNTKKDNETGNIKTIIPNISDKYFDILQVFRGNLIIKTQDKELIKVAQSLNIQVNPYDLTEDGELTSSNNNLLLLGQDGTLLLPDSINKIGDGAFSGVEGLKTLIIPESVTEIGNNAFSNNTSLEKVIIRGNLLSIGDYAFYNVQNLKEINLPDSINYIGGYAFWKTGITEITLPQNLKVINVETFCGCRNLKKIILNDGLEKINSNAFQSCPIEEISFPQSLSSIDVTSFRYCTNLKNIDVTNNINFVFESNMLLNKNKNKILFISNKALTGSTFEIPNGISDFNTSISSYSNIKNLIIPSTLKSISAVALPSTIENVELNGSNPYLNIKNGMIYDSNTLFMCFSKEKNITIPEGIKTIAPYGFYQAPNLEIVSFPETLKTIRQYIFNNSLSINTINIGKNVDDISPIFYTENSYYNKKMNINIQNPYYVVEDNILYKKSNGKKTTLVSVMKETTSDFTIDNDVTSIGAKAFLGHIELEKFSIKNGIEEIGSSLFSGCTNLKTVTLPQTLTQINENAFNGCNNLEELIINNKTNSIAGAPWGASKGLKIVKWMD